MTSSPDALATDLPPAPPENAAPPRPARVVIAWCLIIICTVAIMMMQYQASKLPPSQPTDNSPGLDMVLVGRLALGFEPFLNASNDELRQSLDGLANQSPFVSTDRLRAAVIIAELDGSDAALERIERLTGKQLNTSLEPVTDFLADHALLKRIYSEEAYVPTSQEAQRLIQRHGWFGELAAGYNLPISDPLRQGPRNDASNAVYLIFGFGLVIVLAFLAGLGLMITAIILAAMGKLRARFLPGSLPHNSAYLEMVAVFLLAFIVFQLLAALLQPHIGIDLLLPVLVLLVLPLFWPLLCGISTGQFRKDMGLFAPRGLIREIGAGILGYLAGLPIVFVGALVTIIIAFITGLTSEHPAGREIVTGGTYPVVAMLLAAVIWAPLVEEVVFRAAFYRHLRKAPGWATWLVATVLTSFIFAAIHPQGVVGIPLLMSIAFVLAGLRQWRGSLAAPIAAHALHNGTMLTIIITMLYL
ncbi:MAG: CPBP family intramembrane metalloprotease [Phycisphaeraceae bacterium]|nr:CPBP family intramembrane metalloprotease [Phycisphaeraceae bacterium]